MKIPDTNSKEDQIQRMYKVFDFIDTHLDENLSLEVIASVASFSPFYFHRIFRFIIGESLHQYISRRRLEKAALDLLHKNSSATQLAYTYGFSDISSFSKAFKKHFLCSPTTFKKQNPHRHHKINQVESKNGQVYPTLENYICRLKNLKNWITMNAKIEVKELPSLNVAYTTCIGAQHLGTTFNRLIEWAGPKGLMNPDAKLMTVYYDSFKVTPADKVRMSACIVLDHPIVIDNDSIGEMIIEGGKYIVGSFVIGVEEFEKSWTGLFLWMNENGYTKADKEPFEMYHNNFNEHPERKAIVDFYIPVK